MSTRKTAHPAKTHGPSLETIFLREDLFSAVDKKKQKL